MITESEAWTYLYKLWRSPISHPNGDVSVMCCGQGPFWGLCSCIYVMRSNDIISREVCDNMISKIDTILAGRTYMAPLNDSGARIRVRFVKEWYLESKKGENNED